MAHRVRNLPTVMVLTDRSEHKNVQLCTLCLLCGNWPETVIHIWEFGTTTTMNTIHAGIPTVAESTASSESGQQTELSTILHPTVIACILLQHGTNCSMMRYKV